MFDIYTQLQRWSGDNAKQPIYLATITDIEGSAVRGAGATMGIAADNSLTGSVSGGCIESTVIETVKMLRVQNKA
ncbi:MAG: XdhC family protein, partial [Spirochaetia bacterium]|nr:XdhC family protein [Spirochaetia bacterium]